MIRRLIPFLFVLGLLACSPPPAVEPRFPPRSLLSEPFHPPDLCKAIVDAFAPECAALIPYEPRPPIVRPQLVEMAEPKLPTPLRFAKLTGTAVLDIIVDESGRVCDARVQRGHISTTSWSSWDKLLQEALIRSRFRPATFGGVPIAVIERVTVRLDR